MLFDELITLLIISLIGVYWYDAMQAREIAKTASIKACKDSDLGFLDDTVSLRRLTLGKNKYGRMSVIRQYRFDFSSDGYSRYHGTVTLYGKTLTHVELGVYRI
ncbi:MAG: DUF3301 domain-containing protein [Gammaproteobacteria bacterium]|nr:DUF3301 domain-containing protein [Gammaproteobacteria bacterium]